MGLIQNYEYSNLKIIDAYKNPCMDDPVIFNKNGEVVSYFKDDIWDFSSLILTNSNTRKIHFNINNSINEDNKNLKLKYHLKCIVYGFIYLDIHSHRNVKIGGFIQVLNSNIIFLKNMCDKYSCDLKTFLESKFLYEELNFIFSAVSFGRVKQTVKFFKQMEVILKTYKLFYFKVPSFFDDFLKKYHRAKIIKNQTLVIPIRILSELIYGMDYHLKYFIDNKRNIENLFLFFEENKLPYTKIVKVDGIRKDNFIHAINLFSLEMLCMKYKIKNFKSFLFYLRNIQKICLVKIIALTGMRFNEAYRLNFNCLNVLNLVKGPIYIINGNGSKSTFENTSWIASSGVVDSFDIAKFLSYLFYKKEYESSPSSELENFPLFPVLDFKKKHSVNQGVYSFRLISMKHLNDALQKFDMNTIINEKDYEESKKVNMFYDFYEKMVVVGNNWHFTYHQFRRSLIVYACRSGLVDLPSLKLQMNHLTTDMTSYYGGNSHNAENFIFDNSLVKEFFEESTQNKIDCFNKEVIMSSSYLFGAEGTRLQNLKNKNLIPLVNLDRKKTLNDIKTGKFSYRSTPIGGCARVEKCDKLPLTNISECLLCSFAIFTSKSFHAIDTVKKMLIKQIDSIDKSCVQYEFLINEIKVISDFLEKNTDERVKDEK